MKLTRKHVDMILRSTSKCWIERKLKHKYKRIYAKILEQTQFLLEFSDNPSIFERLFCIQHDLYAPYLCKTCKTHHVQFDVKRNQYRKWCSPKCQASDPDCIAQSKETKIEKYGDENYNGSEKSRVTRMQANNGKWHADDFGEKVKAGKIRNGHDENWTNSELAKRTIAGKLEEDPDFWKKREQKSITTKIANGHDGKWNNRDKFKDTLASFSDDQIKHRSEALSNAYRSKSEDERADIVQKRKNTCTDRYGVFPVFLEPSVKLESEEKMLAKYGVRHGSQIPACKENKRKSDLKRAFNYLQSNEYDQPEFDVQYLEKNRHDCTHEYDFKCIKCGTVFKSTIKNYMGIHRKCPICFPVTHGTSAAESELYDFIKLHANNVIRRDKTIIKPLELDFVLPDLKIAIEFDGLYWHCEDAPKARDKNYHSNKTEKCEQAGYRLIHIFENEWFEKKEIVKSELICAMRSHDFNDDKLYDAREIDYDIARDFLVKHCLFESANASACIGLYSENSIVGVMTFCRSRFDRRYEWEMLRVCILPDSRSIRNYDTMLRKFESVYRPKSVVCRIDRRWYDGNDVERLGFQKISVTKPDYWYFHKADRHLEPGIKFRKSVLRETLKNFDQTKSEVENMKANGWRRIFDCGKLVYAKKYDQARMTSSETLAD